MDYENDKDAEDAMEALKGKNMGGRSLNIGKFISLGASFQPHFLISTKFGDPEL